MTSYNTKGEVVKMDKDMELKIVSQLSLNVRILFCKHSKDKVCEDCLKNICGDVSDISGDVSGIYGRVSGISGDVSDIKKVLEKEKKDTSSIPRNTKDVAYP